MGILKDLRFGLRMLWKNPGITAAMVFALAVGIGLNVMGFTLVETVLFRSLPLKDANHVMFLSCNDQQRSATDVGVSYPDFKDWQAQSKSFDALAAYTNRQIVIRDSVSTPDRLIGTRITVNTFSLTGQKPIRGRDFLPGDEDPGAARVAIISYDLWQKRYSGDENVVGKSIFVDGTPSTITGVMPKDMKFPLLSDLWVPLVATGPYERREVRSVQVFGHLAPGVTLSAARTEMEVISRRLQEQYPASNKGLKATVIPYNEEFTKGNTRATFLMLLGAVTFVLLIACANVANLLLARSSVRAAEISTRISLGAKRWRIIRQLLIESGIVGILGGLVGLAFGLLGVRMFDLALANIKKPYWIVFRPDWSVFAYLAGICFLTSILFGTAPAIQLSRTNIYGASKSTGRGPRGGRWARVLTSCLVIFEVAVSVVLLVGAGLMIRSFLKSYETTAGVNGNRYLTMRLALNQKYAEPDARIQFYDQAREKLGALAGIQTVNVVSNLPMQGALERKLELEDKPSQDAKSRPSVSMMVVSPGYFQALGISLIRGRVFTDEDGGTGKEAVIVNQRFAGKYWANGEDPVGKRIRLSDDKEGRWLTIVGVSQDVFQTDPRKLNIDPVAYVPYRFDPEPSYFVLMRSSVPPTSLGFLAKNEIQQIDPDLPVSNVMTLEESYAEERWPYRIFGSMFALFAGTALLLSAVGLFAVISYSVVRRTQEFGVRMAMGALPSNILTLILKQGMLQLGTGLVIGVVAALGVARLLQNLLVQITAVDPRTFIGVAVLLLIVGFLACLVPARRAFKINPVTALRYE